VNKIKEVIPMATKTDKPGTKKIKRLSNGKRTHVRRLKQEARKTAGTSLA
jgi:hypothetical protein